MKEDDKQSIEAVDVDGGITSYTLELLSVDVRRTKGPEKAKSSKAERARLRAESRSRLRRVENSFRARALGTGRFAAGGRAVGAASAVADSHRPATRSITALMTKT